VFTASGYAPWTRDVETRTGETLDLGEIRLEVGVEVAGTLTDAQGKPVGGASIGTDATRAEDTQSAADGTFRLAHLPRQAVALSITAEGFVDVEVPVEPPVTGLRITLSRGGVLVGTVREPAGGRALTDLSVQVRDPQSDDATGRSAWSGVDERGAFRARLLPGRYVVEVQRDDKTILTSEVTLEEGQETPLELLLPAR
jgi:hypothetical protein